MEPATMFAQGCPLYPVGGAVNAITSFDIYILANEPHGALELQINSRLARCRRRCRPCIGGKDTRRNPGHVALDVHAFRIRTASNLLEA